MVVVPFPQSFQNCKLTYGPTDGVLPNTSMVGMGLMWPSWSCKAFLSRADIEVIDTVWIRSQPDARCLALLVSLW